MTFDELKERIDRVRAKQEVTRVQLSVDLYELVRGQDLGVPSVCLDTIEPEKILFVSPVCSFKLKRKEIEAAALRSSFPELSEALFRVLPEE